MRCFSPLPLEPMEVFVMATQKEINVKRLSTLATNMIGCIRHYRKDYVEVLSPKQHELLDELSYSAMELIGIASDMPTKKEIGYRVDNIINRAKFNIGKILSFAERNEENPLYTTYLSLFTFAMVVLDKYIHADEH